MKVSSKDHQTRDYQALRLKEIGLQLKTIREEKDISLGKVKEYTMISECYLKAIEEGNINSLPEPIYIQSFIRKYGNVIGIEAIAEQFPLNNITPKSSWVRSSELRPFHLYLIYIVIISASVGALSNLYSPASNYSVSDSETQLSDAARLKPKPIPKTSKVNPLSKSQVKLQNKLPVKAQDKPVNVGIMMKGESWMRVEVDGEVKFEGILSEGTNKIWTANKNIVLRAGNSAAILLAFNEYPPQPLGQAGEVVEKTFDPAYKPQALIKVIKTNE